jgi:RNA polymerase sigma factor (sigma-70 family)
MTQKARKTGDRASLAGPPTVRPWHDMNEKRDASPCVLGRKFVAVRTRHRNLAQAEARLKTAKANPEINAVVLERLVERRDNAQSWLSFTIATLDEHLRFAVARYDGSLDKARPHPSGRPRKAFEKDEFVKARRLVAYYHDSLTEFKLAAAAAAGTWTRSVCSAGKHGPCDEYREGTVSMKKNGKTITACKHILAEADRKPIGGHAGTEEAAKLLISSAHSVIESCKQHSGREPEVAEQLAWIEVLETAARFDPTASNMARFNTYYTYRARRATQIRSANDCPPGKTRIKGKIMACGTIHVDEDSEDSAFRHPVTQDVFTDNAMKEAVAQALSNLAPGEQEIAALYLMGDLSLRKLAEQKSLTMHQVRKLVATVTEKLQSALKSYADH